jgi:hypothetical protein
MFPAPPYSIDDDAAISRGVARRSCRPARPSPISPSSISSSVTRNAVPGCLRSTVNLFRRLYAARRACEDAKKKNGHERAKVRASRLHILLFILTPNAAQGHYPGSSCIFITPISPRPILPRPCGRYRVPRQTYARTY